MGLQFVKVNTKRGIVVLASGVTQFYTRTAGRPFTTTFNVGDMLDAFDALRAHAPSHITPGRGRSSRALSCGKATNQLCIIVDDRLTQPLNL